LAPKKDFTSKTIINQKNFHLKVS